MKINSEKCYFYLYNIIIIQEHTKTLKSNNTDFSGNNGGLGDLLVTKEAISRGFGKRFRATAYEEGNISTPNRMFVDGTIDFETGPDGYMSGNVFTWGPFSSTSDGNYKGYIQFQCSPIP